MTATALSRPEEEASPAALSRPWTAAAHRTARTRTPLWKGWRAAKGRGKNASFYIYGSVRLNQAKPTSALPIVHV